MTIPARVGRPRTVGLDLDFLLATQDLLAEVGYDRLSMDAIAVRCGAGKATLYRRWPGKSELVVDAVAQLHGGYPVPDTGSLRGDLVTMASTLLAANARRDAVVAGLIPAMVDNAALRNAVRKAIAEPHQEMFCAIVKHAQQRGEVQPGCDLEIIGAVLPAVTFYYPRVRDASAGTEFVERVIDTVLVPALAWRAP
ncbi:TetR/AcrR family transcriptional regulator [Tomitella biformata]|uniref:TetR/AcrR family transcriptional regulator n=1 Tax=Tomitella biformata TaxID=630403 RepID=UPI0004650D16|nr:TetR/AcrR family transcriptional regulator [Tomitella biformata]